MNNVKKLRGEVEIITKKHDIYVSQEKSGFTLDVFKSSTKNPDDAHQDSQGFDDFEELVKELESLNVSKEQIVELKKIWKMI